MDEKINNKKYMNTYLILQKESGEEIVVFYKGYTDGYHHFYDELNVKIKNRKRVPSNELDLLKMLVKEYYTDMDDKLDAINSKYDFIEKLNNFR